MKTNLASNYIRDAIAMLTAGQYSTSYENQIVDTLKKAQRALEGVKRIVVEFDIYPEDVRNQLKHCFDKNVPDDYTASQTFATLLQAALFDNQPMIEGSFSIVGEED